MRIASAFLGLTLLIGVTAAFAQSPPLFVPRSDVHNAGDALVYLLYSVPRVGSNPAAPIDDPGVVLAVREFINSQISTFPIATSWSGASLVGGDIFPASFGPLYAERPQTGGFRHWSVNVTAQPVRWTSIDGIDLRDTGIEFGQQNVQRGDANAIGLRTWNTRLKLSTLSTVLGVSYGVRSWLDVGVSVPWVVVRVEGSSELRALDYLGRPVASGTFLPDAVSATSSGPGDLSIRAKARISARWGDWAVSSEWRLPSGDPNALLGSGANRFRTALIGGVTSGPVSPHFNVGYLWAGHGITFARPEKPADKTNPVRFGPLPNTYLKPDNYESLFANIAVAPSDEILYTVGLDVGVGTTSTASNRLTLAADLIGRVLRDSATVTNVPFSSPLRTDQNGAVVGGASISQPFLISSTANLVFGIVGAKLRLGASDWLLTANVLIPGSRSGLRPGVTPVVGLEVANLPKTK